MNKSTSFMNRTELIEYITELQYNIHSMQSDFAKCAKGISPCFFCAKDESCQCVDDKKCEFLWSAHN